MKYFFKIFLINLFVLIIALSLIEFFIIGSKSYDNRFISFREYPPELNLNGNKLTDVKGYLGNLQDYNGIIYGSSPIANFDLKLEDRINVLVSNKTIQKCKNIFWANAAVGGSSSLHNSFMSFIHKEFYNDNIKHVIISHNVSDIYFLNYNNLNYFVNDLKSFNEEFNSNSHIGKLKTIIKILFPKLSKKIGSYMPKNAVFSAEHDFLVNDINKEKKMLKNYKEMLLLMINMLKSKELEVIILTEPFLYEKKYNLERIKNIGKENYLTLVDLHKKINQLIREISFDHKLNLIDMAALYPKEKKYFNDGYHFNEKGASLFAEILSSSYCEFN